MTTADGRTQGRERLRPWVERAKRFSGWDFESIPLKAIGPPPPWSYEARGAALLREAAYVLDMGTGGGELFAGLCDGYGGRAVATEEWSTNAPVAARRLAPLGVRVVRCRSVLLPFQNGAFELVLNRHEELEPVELARVLAPGGTALTQQVGRNQWRELRECFPRMTDAGPLFERYRSGFKESGLDIVDARSHDARVEYPGLGELVFMLCVAPWTIPGFDPLGRDFDGLMEFERSQSSGQGIVLTESRFLLEGRKPAGAGPDLLSGSARAGTNRS